PTMAPGLQADFHPAGSADLALCGAGSKKGCSAESCPSIEGLIMSRSPADRFKESAEREKGNSRVRLGQFLFERS
ncbi:hypothetical protein ACC703_38380, partial [Rhizobium ruizarguesonis]